MLAKSTLRGNHYSYLKRKKKKPFSLCLCMSQYGHHIQCGGVSFVYHVGSDIEIQDVRVGG